LEAGKPSAISIDHFHTLHADRECDLIASFPQTFLIRPLVLKLGPWKIFEGLWRTLGCPGVCS